MKKKKKKVDWKNGYQSTDVIYAHILTYALLLVQKTYCVIICTAVEADKNFSLARYLSLPLSVKLANIENKKIA